MKAKYKCLLWFAGFVLLIVIAGFVFVTKYLNYGYDGSEEDRQKFSKAK